MRTQLLKPASVLLLALLLAAVGASARQWPIVENSVLWELSKTTIVSEGTTTNSTEGTLTSGVVLEAKAKIKGGSLIPEGDFLLTLDAFSPRQDMNSQKAGMWYVQGTWTIARKDADPEALKVKHNADTIRGQLMAELPFNPATGKGNWTGLVRLPMSTAAGAWRQGDGTLSFNQRLEGDLYLAISNWPSER